MPTEAQHAVAALRAGQASAVEAMTATLAQIETVNSTVNAIVSLRDPDVVLVEAQRADDSPVKGALHGVPIAIKDLANAKGLPTSMGSLLFAGQVAQADDIVTARLRAAGAIIIGKTNTPAFGLGSHSTNPVFGPTRNPYDPGRSAGGSSGGAGVALATGMLSVADGSDMMGSLRNPAGWNNVYGMRPSWGRVPSEPVGDAFLHQLATNGPMARCPRDLALLLDIMSGPDPRQPHGVPAAPTLPQIERRAAGIRLGWLGDWGGAYAMEPGILGLCQDALAQMSDLGVQIDAVDAPFDRDALWQAWTTLRSFAVAGSLGPLYDDKTSRAALNAQAVWEVEQGRALTAMQVHRASVIRTQWFAKAAALFDTYDVLALPTAQIWPFDVTLDWPREIEGQAMDTYHRWMEVVVPASLIGLPVVAVPVGFGSEGQHKGLPMGLQLIGRRGSDAQLLALAETWHQATGWPDRHPPALGGA